MAKGSRGGKRGQGGYTAKGELKLPDGSKIEFDGDLKYYGNDKNIKGQVRQNIEAFETKRATSKIEYAYAVDKDGNPLMKEKRGGKGSVRVPLYVHDTDGATFTHIHPRGDGMLGGTFSSADLRNFAMFKNTTCRAKAKEGTYSITKGKNFDKNGFMTMVRQADSDFTKELRTINRSLQSKINSGKISYEDGLKQSAKAFNTALINLHNAYKSGEKKYGYTYTLEK